MFDRASSDRFLSVFLPETFSLLFLVAEILSPCLAGATPATHVADVHPGQDRIYLATHVVVIVSRLRATHGGRCVASQVSHKHCSMRSRAHEV